MNKSYWDYKNISQLLELYEFDIILNDDLTLSVRDLQGANLGDIESEKFKTFDEIIDRMEAYHYDYIVRSLEEIYDINEMYFDDWKDMYKWLKENEMDTNYNRNIPYWEIDMLGLICGGVE